MIAALGMFILYRYLLDTIGAADLGVWSIVAATSSLVQMANFGLAGSIVKQVGEFDAKGDDESIILSVQTAALSMAAFSLVMVLIAYPLARWYLGFAIPGPRHELATQLLPTALVAFWVMMLSSIYQGALYGCHLLVSRNLVLIVETLGYLSFAIWLAPREGLIGLVWARLAQNLVTLSLTVLVLKRRLPHLPLVPYRWNKDLFKAVFSYAANFQVISLLVLLGDPLTKGFLSRFGSITLVGYYEMANKMVHQFRSLIVGASQVLVPMFVRLNTLDSSRLKSVYVLSYQVIFFLSIVIFGLVAATSPLLSQIWLGRVEPAFVAPLLILCAAWCINCLALPAYQASLSTGDLRRNVVSHLLTTTVNVVLASTIGALFNGFGVVMGWAIAVGLGGVFLMLGSVGQGTRMVGKLIPPGGFALLMACAASLLCSYGLHAAMHGASASWLIRQAPMLRSQGIVLGIVSGMVYASLMYIATINHPVRHQILRWLRASLSSRSPAAS